jgi:protein PhnA
MSVLQLPHSPKYDSSYTCHDGSLIVCPDCEQEFTRESIETSDTKAVEFRDAFGTRLHDGDRVTVIDDLKVEGTLSTLRIGTKLKNIRLVGGDHDIDCKIKGFSGTKLKTEFVKKANE